MFSILSWIPNFIISIYLDTFNGRKGFIILMLFFYSIRNDNVTIYNSLLTVFIEFELEFFVTKTTWHFQISDMTQ